MKSRCPEFITLLEGSFRTALDAVDAASRHNRKFMEIPEGNGDLSRKVDEFEFARQALKEHLDKCRRCAREGNTAV